MIPPTALISEFSNRYMRPADTPSLQGPYMRKLQQTVVSIVNRTLLSYKDKPRREQLAALTQAMQLAIDNLPITARETIQVHMNAMSIIKEMQREFTSKETFGPETLMKLSIERTTSFNKEKCSGHSSDKEDVAAMEVDETSTHRSDSVHNMTVNLTILASLQSRALKKVDRVLVAGHPCVSYCVVREHQQCNGRIHRERL